MPTDALPGSNGTFQIHAIAHYANNAGTDLGTKTIVVDNADATQPFGSIDMPTQGGTESGTFVNFGWALTPLDSCYSTGLFPLLSLKTTRPVRVRFFIRPIGRTRLRVRSIHPKMQQLASTNPITYTHSTGPPHLSTPILKSL